MSEQESGGLAQKTVRGAAWSGLARVGQQVVQTLSTAILARLLAPETYGLMAMANFFVNLLQQVTDVGTGSALIQREKVTEQFKASMFWLSVLIGVGMAVVVLLLSPLVADFYREPRVTAVMAALSVTFLLGGFAAIPQALLVRAMDYRSVAIVEIGSALAGVVVSVVVAWNGGGVWSLVGGAITNGLCTVILGFAFVRWVPRHWLSMEDIRSTLTFSLNLLGFVMVNYFARNAGHFLIGRFVGPVALGYYQIAYSLMMYPLQNIVGVLGRVMFPAFVQIQNDLPRFRAAYGRAIAVIAAIAFPIMLGMTVVSQELIAVFLGAKWMAVAPLLIYLAPVGALQSIISPVGQIFMAKGRTDKLLHIGILSTVVQLAGYMAGVPWGVTGIVVGYGIANVLVAVPGVIIPLRLIEMRVSELARVLVTPTGLSVGMMAAAYAGRLMVSRLTSQPSLILGVTVAIGVVTYAWLLLWFRPPVLQDLVKPLEQSRIPLLRRLVLRAG